LLLTDARPEACRVLFPNTGAVGAHFGRRITCWETRFQFRGTDLFVPMTHTSTEASQAAVHFSSPKEDAQRRDFTINGMFYNPGLGEHDRFLGSGGPRDTTQKGCAQLAILRNASGRPVLMLRAGRFATVLVYRSRSRRGSWGDKCGVNQPDQRLTNSRRSYFANFPFTKTARACGAGTSCSIQRSPDAGTSA